MKSSFERPSGALFHQPVVDPNYRKPEGTPLYQHVWKERSTPNLDQAVLYPILTSEIHESRKSHLKKYGKPKKPMDPGLDRPVVIGYDRKEHYWKRPNTIATHTEKTKQRTIGCRGLRNQVDRSCKAFGASG